MLEKFIPTEYRYCKICNKPVTRTILKICPSCFLEQQIEFYSYKNNRRLTSETNYFKVSEKPTKYIYLNFLNEMRIYKQRHPKYFTLVPIEVRIFVLREIKKYKNIL